MLTTNLVNLQNWIHSR